MPCPACSTSEAARIHSDCPSSMLNRMLRVLFQCSLGAAGVLLRLSSPPTSLGGEADVSRDSLWAGQTREACAGPECQAPFSHSSSSMSSAASSDDFADRCVRRPRYVIIQCVAKLICTLVYTAYALRTLCTLRVFTEN